MFRGPGRALFCVKGDFENPKRIQSPFGVYIALLLLFDVAATYMAYWFASLLTNVYYEVLVNREIFFMLGILTPVQRCRTGALPFVQ